jgi:quercetin dioxygenase-like cupin family protein
MVPRGQGAPLHFSDGDHVILMLEGEADFEFPSRPGEHFVLTKYDILFIPGLMPFEYHNVGESDVLWFTTVGRGKNGVWPTTASYEDGKTVYTWDHMTRSGMV